jgi:glycosyltransferase involved in cell wall biosynthesis
MPTDDVGPLPLVSICIPTYNNARMVGDALRSAMAQTHSNLEIVVLDNHSTDDTEAVVRRVAGGDTRVRYVRHEKNVGMAGNFNCSLEMSSGELVLILCADDFLEPSCAKTLAEALSSEIGTVLAACGRRIVDAQLNPLKISRPRSRRETVAAGALIVECFVHSNILGEPSAVMFRRSASLRGFREEYNQLLDLEMWFHLLSQGNAVCLPDVLSNIRRHPEQWSNANLRSGRVIVDKQALFRSFSPLVAPLLTVRQKLWWDLRMASSVGRTRRTLALQSSNLHEVFYPTVFRMLCRLTTAAYAAGGAPADAHC